MSQAQNNLYSVKGGASDPVHITNDTLPAVIVSGTGVPLATATGTPAANAPGLVVREAGNFVGVPTDRSGTITTGGVTQNVAAANPNRRYYSFQNTSTAEMRLSHDSIPASATQGLRVLPNVYFETPPHLLATGVITVWSATTGASYSAEEG